MADVPHQNQYERRGDRVWCRRHDVLFAMTGVCLKCTSDPGPEADIALDEQLGPAPEGCQSTTDIERELARTADLTLASVHAFLAPPAKAALVPGKGEGKRRAAPKPASKFLALGFKGLEQWLKIKRAQVEIARAREDAELVRRRESVLAARRRGRSTGGRN
jgi:hypothetical protein